MKQIYAILLSFLALSCILGCTDKPLEENSPILKEVRIAVILPAEKRDRWDRIIDMARSNISEATGILPVIEFYDENSHDLMTLAYGLARDESIVSVIGCEGDSNTETLAYQMSRLKNKKPMFTFNTSQEVIRKYSRQGFMWGLSESDITQSEVILAQIGQSVEFKEVALLACSSSYGQTFVDWFAFQAHELGLDPVRICQYSSINEIAGYIDELSELMCPIVCVPDNAEEAAEMARHPRLFMPYFTHKAFSDKTIEILKKSGSDESIFLQGITLAPDPSSGFQDIYEAKYGQIPAFGEAQLYDAIMVTCLAHAVSDVFGISVNQATSDLLKQEDLGFGRWRKFGIEEAYSSLTEKNELPYISGASGQLSFHPEKHTIIQYSTYSVQYMSNFKFYQTDYISRADGKNTSSIHGAWEWNKFFDQDFDQFQEDAGLKDWKGNKAVLIAASSGWSNYRHQADILEYYHMLKGNGFTDDDIILIAADDLAQNKENPQPGTIIGTIDPTANLYENVEIDYRLNEITVQDLKSILLGESSEKLNKVLDSDEHDNLLFVWSGHGLPQSLVWNGNEKAMNSSFFKNMLQAMHDKGKYRKMLGIIEACYSGSVAKECTGIPKLLLMTATNDMETSKAEHYDIGWNTYLSNTFSSSVLNAVGKNNEISIKDLYSYAFSMTMGSHVTLYNVDQFGNVFTNYADEYFTAP